MSELDNHLAQVQDIATRARAFQGHEASDPKEFSRLLVEDLGALADAVTWLIKQARI